MIVTDGADAYLVPMTYRATPGKGTLIGTMHQGVLGCATPTTARRTRSSRGVDGGAVAPCCATRCRLRQKAF